MGLADRLFGDDEQDEEEGAGDEQGDFFGSGEGDDLGDMGEADDWDDEDGDLDEFDDDGTNDLEPRLDELENEVAGISSTVSTVRSENEEISESVEEMEDNIRKLLDIYEMVTRGVNPFVDDVQQGSMSEGTFGLFDSPEAAPEAPEEDDDEVMDADADSFFDDGFDDVFGEEESDESPDEAAAHEADVDQEASETNDESGKTFDDLKEEYEGDDPEWSAEDDQGGVDEEPEMETPRVVDEPDEDPFPTSREPFEGSLDAAEEGWEFDDAGSDEPDTAPASDRSTEPSETERADGAKPYLRTLPAGYTSDLVVMEWMAFLLSHADIRETLRAVRYYRTIGWISDDVADDLRTVVTGFEGRDAAATDGGGLSGLTIRHHTRSLEYIGRLEDSVDPEVITDWPDRGGR